MRAVNIEFIKSVAREALAAFDQEAGRLSDPIRVYDEAGIRRDAWLTRMVNAGLAESVAELPDELFEEIAADPRARLAVAIASALQPELEPVDDDAFPGGPGDERNA